MVAIDALDELRHLCPEATALEEAGREYVLLPNLKLPEGRNPNNIDALLCLSEREGYPTRLFLAARYAERGGNWNELRILGRTWHCLSWNYGAAGQRPPQILAAHLRA